MAYTDIDKPTDYFSVNLWVADDASSRALTGFGHTPAMVWTKHRGSGSINPTITDSVRGGDEQLATATTAAEDAGSHGKISVFGTDGITVIDGTNATYPKLYFNDLDPFGASVGGNYVGWSWSTGTAFTNDASATGIGSIDSSGSVNTDAGFSIVSYTGSGANATIAHGLGSAPSMIITKSRGTTNNWGTYHESLGNTDAIFLNLTSATDTASTYWNNTSPTSSVFSVGSAAGTNPSATMIAYCFAEKKGYSKFGSYTGNGNANGTFVYTGFKPAWLLVKSTASNDWILQDTKRNPHNVSNVTLFPNGSDADVTNTIYNQDILSNGFKARTTHARLNGSGVSYIYMAFAENPFVTSTGVPATAR